MRQVLSVMAIAMAILIGTMILPGGQVSAASTPDLVQVTNVPLPVTVGNFPETVRVGGTVSATQSGVWTVRLATPRPFVGQENFSIPDGSFGVNGDGTFVSPLGAVIETITVRIVLPTGQKPRFGMLVPNPNDSGPNVGVVWVPVQFQISTSSGFFDEYVGTVTNVHVPMGTNSAQGVNFTFGRSGSSGEATAEVIVTGLPGS